MGGFCNLLISIAFMAPEVGLEPTTLRLTAECSAIELLRNVSMAAHQSARHPSYLYQIQRHRSKCVPSELVAHGRTGLGLSPVCDCAFALSAVLWWRIDSFSGSTVTLTQP